jgi:cytochrome c553
MEDGHNRRAQGAGMITAAILCAGFLMAQPAPKAPSPAGAPSANLNQLMRALFFPNSNVVFFPQRYDPAAVKPASEPSGSTDPLTGVFGGWEAVENSALTLADSADLLMTPGRKCSNGRDVPLANADWVQMVNGLRDASMFAYKAALTKDQDKMLEASEVLSASCASCHNKYRPGAIANRCR